jgi:hypothetical protein
MLMFHFGIALHISFICSYKAIYVFIDFPTDLGLMSHLISIRMQKKTSYICYNIRVVK